MKSSKRFALFFIILFGASCSLAPFSATNSARTLGAGNAGAEFGNANSSYFIRSSFGIGESMDLGYVMEFGSGFSTSGLFGKYAILNNATGPSFALEGGYGGTETSTYYYGGAVGSIAFSQAFEIFANARINDVETDKTDVEVGDSIGNMTLESYDVTYILATTGFNIWFSENMGLSLYGSYVFGNDIIWENGMAMGGSFLLKL